MSECYINSKLENLSSCDHGFAGATHALSAVAIFFIITAFVPNHIFTILGSTSLVILVLAAINVAGASLVPDLDNTNSTSESALGMLGSVLSFVFRGLSVVAQTVIRLPKDDEDPNPHRGLFHTVLMALIMGILVYLGTLLNTPTVNIPKVGTVTGGTLFAIVISWMNLHMALAGLAKPSMKKLQRKGGAFGELIVFGFSLTIIISLFSLLPAENLNYQWLGVSMTLGMLIHIFGDCFTKYGCPILFPIPHKGRLWWYFRFAKITSGGLVENYVFIPFFFALIIIAFGKVLATL